MSDTGGYLILRYTQLSHIIFLGIITYFPLHTQIIYVYICIYMYIYVYICIYENLIYIIYIYMYTCIIIYIYIYIIFLYHVPTCVHIVWWLKSVELPCEAPTRATGAPATNFKSRWPWCDRTWNVPWLTRRRTMWHHFLAFLWWGRIYSYPPWQWKIHPKK